MKDKKLALYYSGKNPFRKITELETEVKELKEDLEDLKISLKLKE